MNSFEQKSLEFRLFPFLVQSSLNVIISGEFLHRYIVINGLVARSMGILILFFAIQSLLSFKNVFTNSVLEKGDRIFWTELCISPFCIVFSALSLYTIITTSGLYTPKLTVTIFIILMIFCIFAQNKVITKLETYSDYW